MKEGARIQTNKEFAEFVIDHNTLPWRGVLIERHPPIEGCWVVRFDHIKVIQFINEAFIDKEQRE